MPASPITPTAGQLVDALAVAGGDLDDEGRRIALATYRLLTEPDPVTVDRIAAAVGADAAAVEARLDEWAGVFRDGEGAVVGFWGLARNPLDPEYRLDDPEGETIGYAWCAWDTLFLPTVLDRPLDVSAADALTGEPIRLTVTPRGAEAVSPPATVVSFLSPAGEWEADIITSFCHKVLFFADQANADRWIAGQADPLFTLSVAEAFDVGRRWTADRYGDRLAAGNPTREVDS